MKNMLFENVFGENAEDLRQLMFDASFVGETKDGITKKEASKKIRTLLCEAMGIEDGMKKSARKRKFKEHLNLWCEIVEDVLEDMITAGWQDNEWFQNFVDEKNLALGDNNEFYANKDVILSVGTVNGDSHDLVIQKLGEGQSFNVKLSTYAIKVGGDIDLFLTGRRDWTELTDAIYKAFNKLVMDMMYVEVINVGDKLPADANLVITTPMADATAKDLVDGVIDKVDSLNDGAGVILIGTRHALRKLSNLTTVEWYPEIAKEERYKTGRLGNYEGIELMEVPQRYALNDINTELIDKNTILVMPKVEDKFVKFVNSGEAEIVEVTEKGATVDDFMTFEYKRRMGINTVCNVLNGVIKITD